MTIRTADNIYNTLIEEIISGRMTPGESLIEKNIAEQFGVSRTPVREALHRLEQANLAERGPRRAFIVRKMKTYDLAKLFEAVGEVESSLASLAALRMSEIERLNLKSTLIEGHNCGDNPKIYGQINAKFHSIIRAGAHNEILAANLDDLNIRTQPWRLGNFYENKQRIITSRKEHSAITQAILDKNPEETRRLMRSHIASSHVVASDLLTQRAPQPTQLLTLSEE